MKLVPAGEKRVETTVSNSRFIACAAPAGSVEEARGYIASMRTEFPNATHHVPAFVIGHGSSVIEHCSDDGEPAGTAGRPILAVLKGSGLGDIVVVIVRFFGGTKLGTGGLVRAYTDATQKVLAELEMAYRAECYTSKVVIPYTFYERVVLLIREHSGEVLEDEFSEEVSLSVRILAERYPSFQSKLTNLTSGLCKAEVIEIQKDWLVRLD